MRDLVERPTRPSLSADTSFTAHKLHGRENCHHFTAGAKGREQLAQITEQNSGRARRSRALSLPYRHCLPGKGCKPRMNPTGQVIPELGPMASARATYQVLVLFSAPTSAGPLGQQSGYHLSLSFSKSLLSTSHGPGTWSLPKKLTAQIPLSPGPWGGNIVQGLVCARYCSRPLGSDQN